MEHSFNVDVAKRYGVHAAVLLNNISFWCRKNAANSVHFHDGYFWTYNSKKAFAELFPYMTTRQIDYALKQLIDDGVLVTGNYNANAYDRTLWYAITKKGECILQNCEMESAKMFDGLPENVEPIPDSKTDKKQTDRNTNIKKESKKESRKSFDDLIDEYTQNEELRGALRDYIQMRKAIKKPVTNRALELAFKNLDGLTRSDVDKIAIVNQSIMNSWQGLFPLKNNTGGFNDGKRSGQSAGSDKPLERGIGWNKIL